MKQRKIFHNKTVFAGLRAGFLGFGLMISLLILPAFSESAEDFKGEGALCAAEYISPDWFEGAFDFEKGGLAPASLNGKWGLINLKGVWEIEPRFEGISVFSSVGLALARLEGKTGYINRKGEWAIPPQFERGWVFTTAGLALVMRNGKEGVIDTKGDWVVEPVFDSIHFSVNNGKTDITGPALAERQGKWSLSALPENAWTELPIDHTYGFSEGLAPASLNGKWGYINPEGKWEIEPQFETVSHSFSDGLAFVRQGGLDGFIRADGSFAISPQFEHARYFYDGHAWVILNEKWGMIDKKGRWAIPPQFGAIHGRFGESGLMAAAHQNAQGKWGFIDKKGRWAIPPQFEDAEGFAKGLAQAKINGKRGLISPKGEWVIAAKFDYIGRFKQGFGRAVIEEKYNFIREPEAAGCYKPAAP